MMKKAAGYIFVILMLASAGGASISSRGAETKTPPADKVIKNMRTAVKSLKSYSYTLHYVNDGDEFVRARHSAAIREYEPIISKIELVARKKIGSELKDKYNSVSGVQFVAPFHLQLSMDVDDYLPKLLEGSKGYYDPAVNSKEVFLKEPLVGFVFRRPVEENDSGLIMTLNWTFYMIELDCTLANGGAAKISGAEEYDGKRTYMLEARMKNDKVPWKMPCGKDTWNIPKEAWIQTDRDLTNVSQRIDKYKNSEGILKLWIDSETWLPVRKEIRFGEKTVIQQWIKDISLNRVDEKKLLKSKKP